MLYAGFDVATGSVPTTRPGSGSPPTRAALVDAAGRLPNSSDNVSDYCGTQCFYDNVIEVDPTDANIVYALGLFNYGTGSGGVFRSTDGGATWKNLGCDLHPDFHAIAINPANTSQRPDRQRRRRLVPPATGAAG